MVDLTLYSNSMSMIKEEAIDILDIEPRAIKQLDVKQTHTPIEPNAVTLSSDCTNTSSEQGHSRSGYLADEYYTSDGEESRFSTSSYHIGRRRKLNYVATDISVDREQLNREMNLLAGSILEEEEEEEEEPLDDENDENSVSADSDHREALHAPLKNDAMDVAPPNTLRYDMDVEVHRLVQRNKRVLLSKLMECGSRRNLTMINLSRRGITAKEVTLLQQTIQSNDQLYVLRLPYNQLQDEGASIIATALSNNGVGAHRQLAVLDLGFNAIGDLGAASIAANAIAGNPHLQCLCLCGNNIGEKGALSIAGGILQGSSLKKLSLAANQLRPNGVKALVAAITQNNDARTSAPRVPGTNYGAEKPRLFEELDLSYTQMFSDAFPSIPRMMLSNSSLKVLVVAGNALDDNDMAILSQALTQNKTIPLETIDCSFNDISCVGVESLMNAVWGSDTLRHINLCKTKIKDRGAQLCAVVLTSIELKSLNIGFNKIASLGIKTLMKNVSENGSLESLTLSGIQMDQSSAKAISFALAHNHSLRRVYLDTSLDGFALQRHIVAGIVSNRLSKLQVLTGFNLGPIANTLGVPKLPVEWSNDQVLGFFRLMWRQWLLKSRNGVKGSGLTNDEPAAPAAVAIAAKIAFSSLGGDVKAMFATPPSQKPPCDQSSVEPAAASLLERRHSGTVVTPLSKINSEVDINDFVDGEGVKATQPDSQENNSVSSNARNQEWLRLHHRSLCDVGNLPFRTADLWQLHQYFFSPPEQHELEEIQPVSSSPEFAEKNAGTWPPQTKGGSVTNNFSSLSSQKRMSIDINGVCSEPQAKKAKSFKARIAYFPRTMEKVQLHKAHSPIQVLILLRQLKYIEASLFNDRSPYHERPALHTYPTCSDVDYILLELL